MFFLNLKQYIYCRVGCFIDLLELTVLCAHLCQKLGRFTEPFLQLSLAFSAEC